MRKDFLINGFRHFGDLVQMRLVLQALGVCERCVRETDNRVLEGTF